MLEIKKITDTTDLLLVRELALRVWPQTYSAILTPEQTTYMLDMMYSFASLQRQKDELQHQFVMGYEEGVPVAFASYAVSANTPELYKLHKIYILASMQGKGVGKQLINYISDDILQLGASSLELNVNRHNKALFFYEKSGFIIVGEEDIDIGNGFFMNDYVMRKQL